jgi:hypothetical protein
MKTLEVLTFVSQEGPDRFELMLRTKDGEFFNMDTREFERPVGEPVATMTIMREDAFHLMNRLVSQGLLPKMEVNQRDQLTVAVDRLEVQNEGLRRENETLKKDLEQLNLHLSDIRQMAGLKPKAVPCCEDDY